MFRQPTHIVGYSPFNYFVQLIFCRRILQMKLEDPAETLYVVARHVCAITLAGYINASGDAKFNDVANAMLEAESNQYYREVIRKEFDRRLIFDASIKPMPSDRHVTFKACGAMQVLHDDKIKDILNEALKDKQFYTPQVLSQSDSSLNKSNGSLNQSTGSLNESKTDLQQTETDIPQSNTSLHESKGSLDKAQTDENQSNTNLNDAKDSSDASESDVKITMSDIQDLLDGEEK